MPLLVDGGITRGTGAHPTGCDWQRVSGCKSKLVRHQDCFVWCMQAAHHATLHIARLPADVIKCLALGASAVLVGRPLLWVSRT